MENGVLVTYSTSDSAAKVGIHKGSEKVTKSPWMATAQKQQQDEVIIKNLSIVQ